MRSKDRKPGRRIKHLCSTGIALGCITGLVMSLYTNYNLLQEQNLIFSPTHFGVSLLPFGLSYLFIPSMWCRILASLGVSLSYRKAFCIQYLSHLGRYIPGKVWAYVAQSYLASQERISLTETLCSNAILMGLMHLSSLCIFALSFLAWNVFTFSTRCLLVLVSFSLIYFLLRMHWLERGVNVILARLAGLRKALQCQKLPYTPLITEIALSWLIFSIGLHLMIMSFQPVDMTQSFIILGTFSISWLIGYYTFIAPGGLGVQEGVQVYLLTFFFPLPTSIIIALALRLWMVLGDAIVFLIAVALTLHENRMQRSAHGSYL
jgi:glycosyltransferase 2 family protein